jgi:hypothetical protein
MGLFVGGCAAPPPGGPPAAAPPGGGATPSPTVHPADLSKALLVWNGDDQNPKAETWSSCDTQPCVAKSAAAEKAGAGASRGIEFQVETTKGWAGFGFNWTSYYAPGASDVTGRKTLAFMLQVEAPSADEGPDIGALQVMLRCAKVKQCAKGVTGLAKYEPAAGDGKWHRISVPLADMKPDKGSEWDDASAWELMLSEWAPTPKKFVLRVDDITFE